MQFDWFTFVAQIVNFLILLLLLRRFLYAPVLQAMTAREEKIATRVQEADAHAQEAQREAELFHQKRKDLDAQRTALLSDVVAEADERRKQLVDDLRQEVESLRQSWFEAMDREKATYLQALRLRINDQVMATSRRVLKGLANATLEEQIVNVFIQRLRNLEESEKSALRQLLQNSKTEVLVRSAFSMNESQQANVERVIREMFDGEYGTLFEQTADLLCGVELQVYGHRISWSIQDYMESFEELVQSQTKENAAHGSLSDSRRRSVISAYNTIG